ncbi:MTH1187 family thiamine-binding protein [Natrarchaeobius sp. A-rgal3]|uniref:MTH1187 family thiamine-binding protein n=1 Tax=Natrarchaeobius versutus TaxID=1679078 RepID=UPI00350FC532
MTVVALLSVAPVVEDSMSDQVAKAVDALEEYDVEYETNPMGTVIETDEIGELFAAAQAAHEAVDGDRVSTVLKIDDKRTKQTSAAEKVEAVEEQLGRPATSDRG